VVKREKSKTHEAQTTSIGRYRATQGRAGAGVHRPQVMMTKTLHYWGADESRDKDNASPAHVLADAQAHGSEQQANIAYESFHYSGV